MADTLRGGKFRERTSTPSRPWDKLSLGSSHPEPWGLLGKVVVPVGETISGGLFTSGGPGSPLWVLRRLQGRLASLGIQVLESWREECSYPREAAWSPHTCVGSFI